MDNCDTDILAHLWGEEITAEFYTKLEKLGVADKFFNSFNHGVKLNKCGIETLEFMTISAYLAQGIYGAPLKFHLIACRRLGISKEHLIGAIMHLTTFIGFPRVVLSLDLIDEVYS